MSWNKIPNTLPPIGAGRFSPKVWAALHDGRVVPAQCLHPREHEADEKLPTWFIEPLDGQRSGVYDEQPLAWRALAAPAYPEQSLLTAGDKRILLDAAVVLEKCSTRALMRLTAPALLRRIANAE